MVATEARELTAPSAALRLMPYDVQALATITAGLSLEEEGALHRAMRMSWSMALAGEAPGTLPDDDRALSRIIGSRRKPLVLLLRKWWFRDASFSGDSPRLVWPWLRDVYAAALVRYRKLAAAGQKGGRARRDERRSDAQASLKHRTSSLSEKKGAAGAGSAAAAPPPLVVPDHSAAGPPAGSPLAGDAEEEHRAARAWIDAPAQADLRAALELRADLHMAELFPTARGQPARANRMWAGIRARYFAEQVVEAYRATQPFLGTAERILVPQSATGAPT